MVSVGPLLEFSYVADHQSSPSGPERALAQPSVLLFWVACGRVWVSLPVCFYVLFPYVSGVYYLRP